MPRGFVLPQDSPIDPRFRVEVLAQTPNPQQIIYAALHQDYSEDFVADSVEGWPDEERAGEIAVKRLLAGDRNHWGCTEHVSIVFNCGWFPHSVMVQGRTHRISSWDCQSGRYTGQRICKVARGELPVDEVFYRRPVGRYTDRKGNKYEYTQAEYDSDGLLFLSAAHAYLQRIERGMSEEHAREVVPYAIRQHFVVSFNLRSLLHLFDLRSKADAQLEIRQLCQLMWPHVRDWVPQIAEWYEQNRLHKARLAP